MKSFSYLLIFTLFLNVACKEDNVEQKKDKTNTENNEKEKLSEAALLDTIQKQTLNYFWEYAEPNSGMARERFNPDGYYPKDDAHIVTTGGTGFGLMSLVVGMERNFIPRQKVVDRLDKIANFLAQADRYHGAWSHWINGESGHTQSFSEKDDGGDIVETAFLAQGFIVVREYLENGNEAEKAVAAKYDELWRGIEWNWYTNGKNVLYWHWSPSYQFEKNFALEGYNETLITYILAASSPTHPITAAAYHEGWARSGGIQSSDTPYGIPLVLEHNIAGNKGGPLFWAHYSYLGLNPKGLSDKYANYWDVTVNHARVNYLYCVKNSENHEGYSKSVWGLSASYTKNDDGSIGYTAHAPSNDRGVISPTAAVSSIPYLPEASLRAIEYFYYDLHDMLWGPAGFYDAFSLEGEGWVAERYLAIDQGPMIVMIENYRTGLIWNLFMGAEEIQNGLDKLGFSY